MDNQQIPKADSKFQKIARANHKKWKIRLLSHGGQKADSGGGPYKEKPDYNRAKSAPPGFGGLEETEQLDEVIRKKDGKYCLFSKKTKRNLGCYPTRSGAMKRERQVQYFKHLKEEILKVLQEVLEEKDDRCTRIAKRKYKAWPSAYASGAVVKCRQGKIWKKVSEGAEELEEEWSEKYKRSIDCKHPKGFSQKAHCQGKKKNEEVELEERKLGKPSSETNLGDWFKRKGAPGKKGGWVDCNTCRDGKCKPCGRQSGEKRSKYPRCRPTPSQCKGYKRRGSNLQREED